MAIQDITRVNLKKSAINSCLISKTTVITVKELKIEKLVSIVSNEEN